MAEVRLFQEEERVYRSGHDWLEQIFREHYQALCAFVYGYTQSDDAAEDIVQELFLAVWRDPARWAAAGNVRLLLFTAARNRALDYLRQRQVRLRHAQRTIAQADLIPAAPAADDDVANKEIRDALNAAVESLPERAREMFRLNRNDGLTYREIADKLGVSIKTVETQMSRSLKKLRAQLSIFLSLLLAFPL